MAFTFTDLIDSLRASRSNFHKHLAGLKDDQWDWKPYPECKSIRETLVLDPNAKQFNPTPYGANPSARRWSIWS